MVTLENIRLFWRKHKTQNTTHTETTTNKMSRATLPIIFIFRFLLSVSRQMQVRFPIRVRIYPTKPTSTQSNCFFTISVSRCRFGGIFLHRCEVGGRNIYPTKPTSTHSYCFFTISVSRCRFGGEKNSTKPTSTHSYCTNEFNLIFHTQLIGFDSTILFGGINW